MKKRSEDRLRQERHCRVCRWFGWILIATGSCQRVFSRVICGLHFYWFIGRQEGERGFHFRDFCNRLSERRMVVGDEEKWRDSGNFVGRVIESADGLDIREKEKKNQR